MYYISVLLLLYMMSIVCFHARRVGFVETMPLTVIFQFFPTGMCKCKFPRVGDLPRGCQKCGSLVDGQDCGGGTRTIRKMFVGR